MMIPLYLVEIFTRLHIPETRRQAAHELADFMAVEDVLFFGKDGEIDAFLPALGMPQTLRNGRQWHAFLKQCATQGNFTATIFDVESARDIPATGMLDKFGLSITVFLGNLPAPEKLETVLPLLPMLGAKIVTERSALVAAGLAASARDASQRADALNLALDSSRRELQSAYELAETELAARREAEIKLKEADRRKDDYLAMLAHELRNPLAPIDMAAQILKMSESGSQQVRLAGEIINRQVGHITNLLDALLDVSRITRGLVTLEKTAVEFNSIVAEAIEQVQSLVKSRQHVLELALSEQAIAVLGDRTRLVQIVTNLLTNAARYTPPGGKISLSLQGDGDNAILAVRDNGIGIEQTLMPYIFDTFAQGKRSIARSEGGLGLGLGIVKKLAELHGGVVHAHSAGAGKGSEFVVTIPRLFMTFSHAERPPLNALIKGPRKMRRLMIVDDNRDAAEVLAIFLQELQYEVSVFYDAKSALEMLRKESPDVLLLDIGLPDMDGYELAKRIKSFPHASKTVLIALTGYGKTEDQKRSKESGFSHHLTKPADTGKLLNLLSEIDC